MSAPAFRFELLARDGAARRGRLHTAHGTIETPAFMPVGTQATVKATTSAVLRAAGAEMILANTYHLMLRPGAERIARLGGLHRFMAWPGPILTDSGGYQVMSLAERRTLDEDGVTFASHLDGNRHRLTPERAVAIQDLLDATVTMALDECTPYPIERAALAASMRRSMRWAERCRAAFRARAGYGLFGIVQGGVDPELRLESAGRLVELGFDGYAIGGLAVGEGQALMFETVALTAPALPQHRPRYLMGVGKPDDLVEAVARGVDLFDCVLPTRNARNGQLFTSAGRLSIRNARYRADPRPPDPACACFTCRTASRAYLRHLHLAGEMTAATLATIHNLAFYLDTLAKMRQSLRLGRFEAYRQETLRALTAPAGGA
jgi:queuine tRNA-ribosyltransferase